MRSTRKEELGQVPCNHGVDQSTDDLGSPIGAFRAAENMRIRAGGLLEKRGGTKGLAGSVYTGTSAAGRRITGNSSFVTDKPRFVSTVRGAPLLGTTSGKMFALDESNPTERWHFQGYAAPAQPVRERLGVAPSPNVFLGCSAINGRGYVLTVATPDTDRIQLRLESPDGALVFAYPVTGLTSCKVRVIAVDDDFVLVRQNGTDLGAAVIDPDNPSVTFASVGTLGAATMYWDIDPYDSTHWVLVYQSAATDVTLRKLTGTTVSNTVTRNGFTGTVPLSVFAESLKKRVGCGECERKTERGDVGGFVYSGTLTGAQNFGLDARMHRYGPPLFGRYRDYQSGGATDTRALALFRHVPTAGVCGTRVCTVTQGGVVSTVQDLWGAIPISKPDNYNRFWGLLTSQETTDEKVQRVALLQLSTEGILDRESPPVVALAAPNTQRVYTITPTGYYDLWHGIGRSDRTSASPAVKRSVFSHLKHLSQDSEALALLQLRTYEYETSEQREHLDSLTLGTSTILAGQPAQAFGDLSDIAADGNGAPCAAEVGFAQTPTIISATVGSGVFTAGTYSLRCVYEWVDTYGNRHLSAPSPAVSITLTTGTGIDLVVSAGMITQRPLNAGFVGGVQVLVYRTLAGGTTYYLDSRVYVSNTLTTGTVSVNIDGIGNNPIAEQEILYTDGGVQQNDLAPSCRFMCKSEDRLWCGGLWDPRIIQCSKVLIPEEPANFSEHQAFQVYLPDECTGLAYQDGQVIAFCERSIYLVAGDGPNDQGFGSFPPPRGYSQDLGCEDYVSVLETRAGIIFKSQKGYYLIPRGFGPLVYIGAAIRDELETNGLTKVYAAAVHGGRISAERYSGHLARWLVGTESSTYATDVFTYDVDNGQWFRDTLDATSGRMLEMGAWPDGFAFMSSNLNADTNTRPIWYETGAFVGDGSDNHYITQRLQTARYQPFGPLGYGHVKRVLVGMKAAPTLACQVTLNVTLDDNTAQTATWSIPTGGAPQYRELPLASPHMCTTLRIAVEDSALNSVMAPGVKLIALGFEADDSSGFRQLDGTERA